MKIKIICFMFVIFISNFLYGKVIIDPGPDAYDRIQEALILAKPNDNIHLSSGYYELEDGLSLDINNVTISGDGLDKTILSFKNQKSGAEGLLVTSDGVTLRDFAVEDTIGDAIVVKKANGIRFLRIRVEWTSGPKSSNGAYGLYPVESKDVLIDSCVAIGASDAGIYVGQSERIKVLNSEAKFNVAGIEIENSYYAEVINNTAHHNTGGILIFDLPNLPQQGGHDILVKNNKVINNDTPNFAPEGNIVGKTPNGTGIMVMANENVILEENFIEGNATAGILVVSYLEEYEDDKYNPLPNRIYITNNQLNNNGYSVDSKRAEPIALLTKDKAPEIIWDGVTNFPEWLGLKKQERLILGNNRTKGGKTDMINLNLMTYALLPWYHEPKVNYDDYKGEKISITPVKFETIWQ